MPDSHRYLITYDIPEDKARSEVSEALERVGLRVQKSVFECVLEPDKLDRLTARLSRRIQDDEGADIRVYRLCANCLSESFGLGDVERAMGSEPWLVV